MVVVRYVVEKYGMYVMCWLSCFISIVCLIVLSLSLFVVFGSVSVF